MSKIRIKDIAQMAQVSTGTVDRVLHGRSGVSESTRKKIQDIIEEYDYQPDIIAGMLASNKEVRILVCMPDVVNAHEFWKLPVEGVERAVRELQHFGIRVEHIRFNQHSKEDFIEKTKDVDPDEFEGLLFAPVFSSESIDFVNSWKEKSKVVVLFNSKLECDSYLSFIGQDAYQSAYLGGKLMSVGLPHGKDVLIVNLSLRKDNYQHIIRRERGFRAYFEEHGGIVNNLVTLDMNGGSYKKVALEIEQKLREYDVAGIFVTNSRVHLVARYLSECGAMNMRLIGYDLLPPSIEYLKREYIDFLISQSPEEQAYMGMRQLYNVVGLKHSIQDNIFLPIDILTKENVDQYINYTRRYE